MGNMFERCGTHLSCLSDEWLPWRQAQAVKKERRRRDAALSTRYGACMASLKSGA